MVGKNSLVDHWKGETHPSKGSSPAVAFRVKIGPAVMVQVKFDNPEAEIITQLKM